ncbi:MAG: FMN-binding protein [Tissierellia bacterium]|nr:FMN-binding protein [Tissierellia bacterium]
MKDIVKMGVTLFLISAIAAGVLAFVNSITAPVIAENDRAASFGKFFEIYGEENVDDFADIDEAKDEEIKTAYPNITQVLEAVKSDEVIGYVISVKSNGYGGEMNNVIIINADGSIQGFRNLGNAETPGFGKVVEESSFYDRFEGKSAIEGEITAGSGTDANSIEGISGSTLTTNGVLKGVNEAVSAYNDFLVE